MTRSKNGELSFFKMYNFQTNNTEVHRHKYTDIQIINKRETVAEQSSFIQNILSPTGVGVVITVTLRWNRNTKIAYISTRCGLDVNTAPACLGIHSEWEPHSSKIYIITFANKHSLIRGSANNCIDQK